MGLLNNDNYIDPFKGADYIDPAKTPKNYPATWTASMHNAKHTNSSATPNNSRHPNAPHTPTGAPSHTTTGARQPTDTNQPNDTHKKIKNTDNHHRHRSADDHRDEPRRHNRQPRRTGLNSGQT